MAFEIFITVFCLKKFDNCIDMVLCLSCLIFGDPFESVESFYQIWKNCGHYFFKWFFCFLLPFFCLIFSYSLLWFWFFCFAFALLSLCFILIPLIALCRFPDFFSFTECNLLLRISSEFFISDIAFFMSRSSIWILHHLFFSWWYCGFL